MQNKPTNGTASESSAHRLDSIRDSVKGLVDQGQEKVNELKDKVVDLQSQVKTRGGDAIDKVSELVKAHPLAAIGAAFGIGFIAMRMVRR